MEKNMIKLKVFNTKQSILINIQYHKKKFNTDTQIGSLLKTLQN